MSEHCNVIIGVTGGIAAYKSPVLIRRLKENGVNVMAVMTNAARHFITPLTLQAVSGNPVRDSLLDANAESGMDHIDLARWASKIVVAPATADFIARLAHGMADDLLTTLCLATSAEIYLAPAMNQKMWQNQATRHNINILIERGVRVLGPDCGEQACGEIGPGRMLEPEAILDCVFPAFSQLGTQGGASGVDKPSVLITAGPTWEAIDPVRGLTNHSSGKMGYSIAQAFAECGYSTTLISGPTALPRPLKVKFHAVRSAKDMYDAVHQHIPMTDIFISVAAVADYRPLVVADQKIKKSSDELHLKLVRNPDILKSVTNLAEPPFSVGFAAETEHVGEHAQQKLLDKKLDMIIANEVGDGKAFGQPDNKLFIFTKDEQLELGPDSKINLARELVGMIINHYAQKNSDKNS